MTDSQRGLHFIVGDHGIVVPSVLVERVLEADVSSTIPLARPWVGGLGVSDGVIFVVIDLMLRSRSLSSASAAVCALLDTGKRTGLRWALRVNRTVGFAEIERCARSSVLPLDWPQWVAGAKFEDNSVAGLLDVAGMTRDFAT